MLLAHKSQLAATPNELQFVSTVELR